MALNDVDVQSDSTNMRFWNEWEEKEKNTGEIVPLYLKINEVQKTFFFLISDPSHISFFFFKYFLGTVF